MVNLGLLEMKELNQGEARKWFTRAAEKGHPRANELLDELPDAPVDPKVCYIVIELLSNYILQVKRALYKNKQYF